MPAGQASADLEEGLVVTLGELVEDQATGRVGERSEWVGHGLGPDDMQVSTCMSRNPSRLAAPRAAYPTWTAQAVSSAIDATGATPRSVRSRLIRSSSGGWVENQALGSWFSPSFMIGFVK